MHDLIPLVVFLLEGQQYALHLSSVERIAGIVEVTPLPEAPDIVLGVVNAEGRIIPAVNIRKRFGHPHREVRLSDRLILAKTSQRHLALWVDQVRGVVEAPQEGVTAAAAVVSGTRYVEGIANLEGGVTLIHDLATFLSLEEERTLDEALQNQSRGGS